MQGELYEACEIGEQFTFEFFPCDELANPFARISRVI